MKIDLLAKEADINSKIKVYADSKKKDTGANIRNVGILVINNKYISKKIIVVVIIMWI